MPTNSVKHTMLKEAKKIATHDFEDFYLRGNLGNVVRIISASEMKDGAIRGILLDHPEFDSGEFRRMIKEIEVRENNKDDRQ